MFRISKVEGRSRTVVTIDGHLAGEYVQIAKTCCEQAISLGKSVHVFLREVMDLDEAGRNLLSRLVASGCRLHASGVYYSHVVQTLKAAGMKRANPTGTGGTAGDKTRRNR
jgi:hypothetical protein